jgi:hypothetical protein
VSLGRLNHHHSRVVILLRPTTNRQSDLTGLADAGIAFELMQRVFEVS